jgi:predicted PhzF superfamily epimerase YddE/YHI9
MNLPFFQVDAFTREPGRGNPAGVYLLPEKPLPGLTAPTTCSVVPAFNEDDYLQLLATERRLPETGFVRPRPEGYALRWFTPKTELPLCGHGTLAAAHILWEQGHLGADEPARFYTASGLLTVRRLEDDWIEMDFPAFTLKPSSLPSSVLYPLEPLEVWDAGDRHLAVIGSEAEIRAYTPDFERLREHRVVITALADRAPAGAPPVGAAAADNAAAGAAATAPATPAYDFVSRYFNVPLGVGEDAVTGSAHCALAPYWAKRLGKNIFLAYQASPRGGFLKIRLDGDRVRIAGQAITVKP